MKLIKILSLNVRGLRNHVKRRALFLYLKNQKADFHCLQETFLLEEDEVIWASEWGGKILFSHRTQHSKGTGILQRPNSLFSFKVIPLKLFYYQTFFKTWHNEHSWYEHYKNAIKKWGHRACLGISRLLKWGIFTGCALKVRITFIKN